MTSSREQNLEQPSTAFWAEREQMMVSVHDPATDQRAWQQYVSGLRHCYTRLGVEHIVTDEILNGQLCRAVWLIRDRAGTVLGGCRSVGPVYDAASIELFPAIHDIGPEPNRAVLRSYVAEKAADGVIELKGGWSAEGIKGLGRLVVRRLPWHAAWWHDVGHTLGTTPIEIFEGHEGVSGAIRIPGVDPAIDYPSADYSTVPIMYSWDTLDSGYDELVATLHEEWSYLGGARNRALGRPDVGVQIAFDLDELVAATNKHIEVNDQSENMRQEGSECLSVTRREDAEQYLAESDRPDPWIYYPWRNTAVGAVRPGLFHTIRTDRNRNKITAAEIVQLRQKTVGVVGLSVGAAIAFTLAQEGLCGQLRLADFDRLELTNMNRLSASLLDLGERKTHIAARRIAELDPYLDLRLYDRGLDRSSVAEFISGLDLVIEECDSLDIKLIVREEAARQGVPVVMESNDRGMVDIERFDLDPDLAPFHGLIGDTKAAALEGLSVEDKVVHILDIIEVEKLSPILGASFVEINESLTTAPQLSSDVHLGAALAVHAAREILLGKSTRSGRVRVDIGEALDALEIPQRATPRSEPPAITGRSLPDDFNQAIVRAAELAPSGGNMQPWRFSLSEDEFVVEAIETNSGMDIAGRGTAVACGAALFNAGCVAAAHGRLGPAPDPFDLSLDLDSPQLIGRVALGDRVDAELASLAPQIALRVTNRQLDHSGQTVPNELVAELERATAATAGARLRYIQPDTIDDLVEAWAESDRVRFITERLHREIFQEVRRPGLDELDRGLDERTLELTEVDRAKLALLRRPEVVQQLDAWDAGHRLGEDGTTSLRRAAGMFVVTMVGRDRTAYVRGGLALQRMWLEATRLDVGLQPASPVFGYAHEVSELTDVVGEQRGTRLAELHTEVRDRLGFGEDESFILALRAHFGPGPSAISDRATSGQLGSGTFIENLSPSSSDTSAGDAGRAK